MDLFPPGGFVRLRSRARGTYVHADENASAVIMRPLGAASSINAVWKVEHCFVEDHAASFLLLQGAAYGRYLTATSRRPLSCSSFGELGFVTVQRDYDTPDVDPRFVWRPHRMDEIGHDYVHLTNWGRCLRANGVPYEELPIHYRVAIHRKVTAVSRMSVWRVETIPPSPVPLPLPPPPPYRLLNIMDAFPQNVKDAKEAKRLYRPVPGRWIRFRRVSDEGNVDNIIQAGEFYYKGRSVFDLSIGLKLRQNDARSVRMCVRAGTYGHPIPLLVDLPYSLDALDIIVMATGSPGDLGLRYPQFDVPEP